VLHLERDGFRCRTASNGSEALREARAAVPDLIVLDLMLPELDGLEVCRQLRRDGSTAGVPIIMLTAKSDEVDRVVGLEIGADDYVAKPFSPKELVARVRAVLRRARHEPASRVLSQSAVTLDPARHLVTLNGRRLELTPKEFDLLHALLGAAGRVLSREHLLNRVWGYARADEIESRTVDVHVRRLRSKLGDAGARITTVKSVGYRFEAD
jgi:two-component system, OmpR family, alkaline phosphatase synthesis response regulator PhoP